MKSIKAICFLFSILIIGGCSDKIIQDHKSFSLVKELNLESLSPALYTTGESNSIVLNCEIRYAGKASVLLVGYAGDVENAAYLESPLEGELGAILFPIQFSQGSNAIPLDLTILSGLDKVGFSVSVHLDSLLVNETMVYWNSEEGNGVFEDDIPPETADVDNSSYLHFLVEKAVK